MKHPKDSNVPDSHRKLVKKNRNADSSQAQLRPPIQERAFLKEKPQAQAAIEMTEKPQMNMPPNTMPGMVPVPGNNPIVQPPPFIPQQMPPQMGTVLQVVPQAQLTDISLLPAVHESNPEFYFSTEVRPNKNENMEYKQMPFTPRNLFDMRKHFYSLDTLNDLLLTNTVYIANINESPEYCETHGFPLNSCYTFPGVMVYSLDEFNNKRVLFVYENQRCCGGLLKVYPFKKRLRRPVLDTSGKVKLMSTIKVYDRPICCQLILIIINIIFTIIYYMFRAICGFICFFLSALDSIRPIVAFEQYFEYDDNFNKGKGAFFIRNQCCGCGEFVGDLWIDGVSRYIFRNKIMDSTCCGGHNSECTCGDGQCCCYDIIGGGEFYQDITETNTKAIVGSMSIVYRNIRRSAFCCSFMSPRPIIKLTFPYNSQLPERYGLIVGAICWNKNLFNNQGRSY